jgi:hypothetical protein
MSEITINDLTEVSTQGEGVFDKLMSSVQLRLNDEFEKGRINGTDYSTVFLGGMNTVLGQSIQFVLQKDISTNQALLLAAQIEQTKAQELNTIKDTELKDKQIQIADIEIQLKTKQLDQMDAQLELLQQQVLISFEELAIKRKELDRIIIEIERLQVEKELMLQNKLKVSAEVLLINEKTKSEKAQTVDVIDGVPVVGVIGKQKELYVAQKDGFANDNTQKMSKLVTDLWSVAISTNPDDVSPPSNMDAAIEAIINKATST